MNTLNFERLRPIIQEQPYPLVFVTISGAHLYGFASGDSDFDIRGVHVLPAGEVVGLNSGRETIELTNVTQGFELDLVTHDVKKFFLMLLKRNGYVLEQLLSPLVLVTNPYHEELKAIAADCVTRHHVHHYIGFANTQWRLFDKEAPRRAKPLLYVYRVLLTGIHLMRTGEVEANLLRLNEIFRLGQIDELVSLKVQGAEKQEMVTDNISFHRGEFNRLLEVLKQAGDTSDLPEIAKGKSALQDLLVRLRLNPDVEWSKRR